MAEMAEIIGVTTRTIEREIPKMENIVRHVEPKNGGYWEIAAYSVQFPLP